MVQLGSHAESRGPVAAVPSLLLALAFLAGGLPAAPAVQAAAPLVFSDIRATAFKDGGRVVITWTTDQPATTKLYWGTTPGTVSAPLVNTQAEPQYIANQAGTKHLYPVYNLVKGATYYFKVAGAAPTDPAAEGASPVFSVVAANGPSRWDASCPSSPGGCYTFNLFVKFDRDVRALEWAFWTPRFTQFAVRVNDMTDGWGRLGTVVLLDSLGVSEEGRTLCGVGGCLSDGDIIVHDKIPYDSHTILGGIESGAVIALGYNGQLLISGWQSPDHFGRVAAHEFGHYAFWMDDMYDIVSGADTCVNPTFDISIMNNNNANTEFDSKDTPCAWQTQNGGQNSWDNRIRPHYPNIPTRVGAPNAGPLDTGGAYSVLIVDRGVL